MRQNSRFRKGPILGHREKRIFGAVVRQRSRAPARARAHVRARVRARFYPPAREFACRGWFSPSSRRFLGLGVVLVLFATARRLKWSTSRLWIFHERLKRASLRGLSLVCVFVCFFDCFFGCFFGCLFGKSVKKGPGEQGRQGKVGEPGR